MARKPRPFGGRPKLTSGFPARLARFDPADWETAAGLDEVDRWFAALGLWSDAWHNVLEADPPAEVVDLYVAADADADAQARHPDGWDRWDEDAI